MDKPSQTAWRKKGALPVFAAVLLAVAALGLALLSNVPTFYENDDANIALALSGARSGAPFPTHPFINCILGFAVSGLYTLLPAVPWWGVVQLAAVTVFTAVSCFCVLRVSARAGLPFPAAAALCGVLALSQLFYPLLLVTFTLTSAAAGTAGVALLLAIDEQDPDCVRARMAAGSLVCLFFCFLFRNSTGYALLCFYFGALCFRVLLRLRMPKGDARKRLLRRAARYALCACLLALCTVLVHKWGLTRFNMPEFAAFDTARSNFIDYPHDSYAANPALYASVGWDQSLYDLAGRWFFMDERVNAEALSAIRAGSAAADVSLAAAFAALARFFAANPIARYIALPPCCMLLSALLLGARRGKERLPLMLAACAFFAGALVLLLYLALRGRMMLRTFQLLAMPLCAAEAVLAALAFAGRKRPGAPALLLCGALALCALFCAYRTQSELRHSDPSPYLRNSGALMDYVRAHPDSLFIADTHVANNIDALAVYPERKPVNLMDWGGTGMYTGFWEKQLAANGISAFTAALFFREDAYFVTDPNAEDLALLTAYLESVYGDVTIARAVEINGEIALYQISLREGAAG